MMMCRNERPRGPPITVVFHCERKGEGHEHQCGGILGIVVAAVLGGCAGQTEQLSMQSPAGQQPQSVTFPNGTTFGGASGRQASELAQIIVEANNNMRDYQQLQGTESKNLQTSR
jgi:hypothetical protein